MDSLVNLFLTSDSTDGNAMVSGPQLEAVFCLGHPT